MRVVGVDMISRAIFDEIFKSVESINDSLVKINANRIVKKESFTEYDMADGILILNRRFFNKVLLEKNITDLTVEQYSKNAFISICDPDSEKYFKYDHENVLNLVFHDITKDYDELILFSDDMAAKSIEFIKNNKDKNFIIHCEAGISRSGAFGQFINDVFEKMPRSKFKLKNPNIFPNHLVYSKLKKIYSDGL